MLQMVLAVETKERGYKSHLTAKYSNSACRRVRERQSETCTSAAPCWTTDFLSLSLSLSHHLTTRDRLSIHLVMDEFLLHYTASSRRRSLSPSNSSMLPRMCVALSTLLSEQQLALCVRYHLCKQFSPLPPLTGEYVSCSSFLSTRNLRVQT